MKLPIYQIRDYVKQTKESFPNADVKYGHDTDCHYHILTIVIPDCDISREIRNMYEKMECDFWTTYSDFKYEDLNHELIFAIYGPDFERTAFENIDLLDPTQFEKAEKYHRERAQRELSDLKQQIQMIEKQLSYKPPK